MPHSEFFKQGSAAVDGGWSGGYNQFDNTQNGVFGDFSSGKSFLGKTS